MDKKVVYMDHAATTYMKPEVAAAMQTAMTEDYGNPSSIYSQARRAKHMLDIARGQLAKAINANDNEVYFTGSGTEADNWAIKGTAYANRSKGRHIITSSIEHAAVMSTCEYLQKQGWNVDYLPVDEYGSVDPEAVAAAIRPDTVLVSIMMANNEIGTIQPVAEIAKICKRADVLFHTDAVQALGSIPIDVKAINADMLSVSAHKIYGPKGVGALYIKKGIKIDSLIHGGHQERGQRAGTENMPGIVGFGKAAELATAAAVLEANAERLTALRQRLINGLLIIPDTRLNGHPDKRLPGNVNVCFEHIEGEALMLHLDMNGIAASSGSACASGSLDPSHVLLAIGLPDETAHGSLRLSLGSCTTEEDVDYVVEQLNKTVARLREISPLFKQYSGNARLV